MHPDIANMLMPLLLLLAGCILLPALMVPRRTLSQGRLAVGIAGTALVLLVLGALLFGWLYAQGGAEVRAALAGEPLGVAGYFLTVSLRAVPFWLPVLGLVWLIRAQGVERRRGEALAEAGRVGVVKPGADE